MTFQIQFYGISNTQLSMDHFIRMIHANRFVTYTFPHEKMYIALKKTLWTGENRNGNHQIKPNFY